MNRMQEQVEDFHRATGGFGTIDTEAGRELRAKLIMEEAVETVAALGFEVSAEIVEPNNFQNEHNGKVVARFLKPANFDILEYIDGLCDLLYVTFGGAINIPVNIERHFDEVHRANMNKLTGPKRADGKQLKPEGWVGPDHQKILDRHGKLEEVPWTQEELAWNLNGN